MKYFSMFSGIGGFELGIGALGECVGYSEIDEHAIKTYKEHFSHENYGDATTINPTNLPDFDLLVGGFPCQAFSVAGKRRGFDEARGTLFFDIARILADKKPRYLVLENVKGLLSHNSGATFQTIIGVLSDLGYGIEWQVLNSKDFGVPQNRERIYIVGHLGERSRRKIFPLSESGGWTITSPDEGERLPGTRQYSTAIDANYYKGADGKRTLIKQLNNPVHSNDRLYDTEGLSPTLNTAQGGNRQPKILAHYGHRNKEAVVMDTSPTLKAQSHGHEPMVAIPVLTPDRPVKRQNGRRFKTDGEPQFTLNTQDRHGIYDGKKIRRLTPTECERLQGFPDGWTIGSDTQRYKQCGNAVTVNVVHAVMQELFL